MLNKEQKVFNMRQMLLRDGFSNPEISFANIDTLDKGLLDALLDSECDEYNMFTNELINELEESYSQHQESMRV